jgi:hypothetical protein
MSASDRLSSEINIDRSDDLVIEDSGEYESEVQMEEEKDVEEIDDSSIVIEDGEQDAHGVELSVKISDLDEPDRNDCADSVGVPSVSAIRFSEKYQNLPRVAFSRFKHRQWRRCLGFVTCLSLSVT